MLPCTNPFIILSLSFLICKSGISSQPLDKWVQQTLHQAGLALGDASKRLQRVSGILQGMALVALNSRLQDAMGGVVGNSIYKKKDKT